jgi:hypothetical protein
MVVCIIKENFMKNQYIGDINDYRKYGLIDLIYKTFKEKILFVWMLTESNNNDGNRTGYLNEPSKYRGYNQELFDCIQTIVKNKKRDKDIKNILAVQNDSLFLKYDFLSDFITDNLKEREEYFNTVYKQAKEHGLIFLDPDNGIEVPSCKYGARNSSKYIYWNEIHNLYEMKKDILIYQHFPRIDRRSFVDNIKKQCNTKIPEIKFIPIVTQNVLFILLTNKPNDLIGNLKTKLNVWGDEIKIDINIL